MPEPFQPTPERPVCKRVILLNIDGLSWYAFQKADMPFLKGQLARAAYAPRGAITVYRALTNPAFASILTGAPPAVHGMVVKLEQLGLITREPGVARSVRLAIPEEEIPELEDVEGPPW